MSSRENWLRIISTLLDCGKVVLLPILHRYLPRDPQALYVEFDTAHREELTNLKRKRIIGYSEWNLLFPQNGETDSLSFDISLLSILILNCFRTQIPKNLRRDIKELKKFRNDLIHSSELFNMNSKTFDLKWTELVNLLVALGYNNLPGVISLRDMRTRVLDPTNAAVISAEVIYSINMSRWYYQLPLLVVLECLWDWRVSFLRCCIGIICVGMLLYVARIHYCVESASIELKRSYKNYIRNKNRVGSAYGQQQNRFYVDLSIIPESDFDGKFQQEDIEHHRKEHLTDVPTNIKMDQLIDNDSYGYVLIRGVGGMGKTHLTEQIALQWASGTLWQHIKFLFLLTSKSLVGYESVEQYLFVHFQHFPIFDWISFSTLQMFANSVLVVVDGVDELKYFTNKSLADLLEDQKIHHVDRRKDISTFTFHSYKTLFENRMIVTGRPESIKKFRQRCLNYPIKNVDIIGFSESSIKEYIQAFFETETTAREVFSLIDSNDNMRLMAKVPVYLNTLCVLFNNNFNLTTIKTATELYIWQFALFVKNHVVKHFEKDLDEILLYKVFENNRVQSVTSELSRIAFNMLVEGKAVFEVDDLDIDKLTYGYMEESGFIIKETSHTGRIRYQFYHLSMQEFLSAVHLSMQNVSCTGINIDKLFGKDILKYFAGLQGGAVDNSNSSFIVKRFAKDLRLQSWKSNSCILSKMAAGTGDLFSFFFEYGQNLNSHSFFWNQGPCAPKKLFEHPSRSIHNPVAIEPHHFINFLNNHNDVINCLNLQLDLTFSRRLTFNESQIVLKRIPQFLKVIIHPHAFDNNAVVNFCSQLDNRYVAQLILSNGTAKGFDIEAWFHCLPYVENVVVIDKYSDSKKGSRFRICQYLNGRNNLDKMYLKIMFIVQNEKYDLFLSVLNDLVFCLHRVTHVYLYLDAISTVQLWIAQISGRLCKLGVFKEKHFKLVQYKLDDIPIVSMSVEKTISKDDVFYFIQYKCIQMYHNLTQLDRFYSLVNGTTQFSCILPGNCFYLKQQYNLCDKNYKIGMSGTEEIIDSIEDVMPIVEHLFREFHNKRNE